MVHTNGNLIKVIQLLPSEIKVKAVRRPPIHWNVSRVRNTRYGQRCPRITNIFCRGVRTASRIFGILKMQACSIPMRSSKFSFFELGYYWVSIINNQYWYKILSIPLRIINELKILSRRLNLIKLGLLSKIPSRMYAGTPNTIWLPCRALAVSTRSVYSIGKMNENYRLKTMIRFDLGFRESKKSKILMRTISPNRLSTGRSWPMPERPPSSKGKKKFDAFFIYIIYTIIHVFIL